MQAYGDPKRANDPHALPDVEVFRMTAAQIADCDWRDGDGDLLAPGYFWWSCFPGCMPDSDPFGPFDTEAEALADAQANADDDDESERAQ